MRWSGVSYLRIAGAVAAAALLAFLWWRVSLSFSQGDVIDEQRGHIKASSWPPRATSAPPTRSPSSAASSPTSTQAFHDELTKKPLTHEVPPHVDPEDGQGRALRERDPARYRELFNQAVTGAAGVP
jgi:hypothetical protein